MLALVFICSSVTAGPVTLTSAQTNKAEIVKRASRSYYSLRSLGLLEFNAKVEPNWELFVKNLEPNPEAMKLIKGLMFSVSLKSDGSVKVDHASSLPIPKSHEEEVKQLFNSVTGVLTGFFMTWKMFMMSSPFPAVESEYDLRDLGENYLLKYKEEGADISTTINKDLAVGEIKYFAEELKVLIRPRFAKSPEGFVLMGYQASYETKPGARISDLAVEIVYQPVKGFRVPAKIKIQVTKNESRVTWELLFTKPEVKRLRLS